MRKKRLGVLLLLTLLALAIPTAFRRATTFPGSYYGRVEVSADGKTVATWRYGDDVIRVCDAETRTERGSIRPPAEHNGLRLSADGNTVVTWYFPHDCEAPGTISVWDVVTRQQRFALTGHSAHVEDVAFSANDTVLVSCSKDKTARIWDLATGKEVVRRDLPAGDFLLRRLAVSPDGKHIVIVNVDIVNGKNKGVWWEVATDKMRSLVTAEKRELRHVVFSPDSQTFAALITDYAPAQIRMYDVSTERQWEFEAPGTLWMKFGPDSRTLAVVDDDQGIALWDSTTGKRTAFFDGGRKVCGDSRPNLPFPDRLFRLTLSDEVLYIKALAFRPDGELFAFGGTDSAVLKWRVNDLPKDE